MENRTKKIKCEIYRDIPAYAGYYQASNLGNIKSLRTNKVLAQIENNSGYPMVSISVNGKHEMKTVHRLVAEAFIENPCGLRDVNHKDGNRKNNNVVNLEWVTHGDNIKHSYKELGRKDNGIKIICVETGIVYKSIKYAGFCTGLSASAIGHAVNGITKSAGGYQWKRK